MSGTPPGGASAGSSGGASGPVRGRVRVLNTLGLHARPATILAARAREFRSSLRIGHPGAPPVDAKNLLDLLFLAAPEGAVLELEGDGPDAAAAVAAVSRLFAERFGTEES